MYLYSLQIKGDSNKKNLNGVLHNPSLCVYMFNLLIVARQRLGKHIPVATNTRNNRRIVGLHISMGLYILLSLLGNNSEMTFPQQQRFFGGVIFYAVSVVSKERRQLVLPRSSCSLYCDCIPTWSAKSNYVKTTMFSSPESQWVRMSTATSLSGTIHVAKAEYGLSTLWFRGIILNSYSASQVRSWYSERVCCIPKASVFSENFCGLIQTIRHLKPRRCIEAK
jgi:hypothetical protein